MKVALAVVAGIFGGTTLALLLFAVSFLAKGDYGMYYIESSASGVMLGIFITLILIYYDITRRG